jgi:predicted Zn-dependent protease
MFVKTSVFTDPEENKSMKEKLPYWASILFSTVALVLLFVNIAITNANRALQIDVAQRQNTIVGGQQLAQVNQGLVQALAEAAFKNNDTQMRDLLATQGITLKNEPATAPATPEKSPEKTKEH